MKADTMYFGRIEFDKKELIRFEEGLFGFESQKDFLPVPFEGEEDVCRVFRTGISHFSL